MKHVVMVTGLPWQPEYCQILALDSIILSTPYHNFIKYLIKSLYHDCALYNASKDGHTIHGFHSIYKMLWSRR